MSKRCSARNCFNCVLYNKSIAYFSFPKNKEFAKRWAELAGRDDLKEKPLNRIVKYYLCSEHFTANCFVDKETKQILKRNLPHKISLPSIFKNNLQETMQNANPRNSIEVHNIILLDVDERIKKGLCLEDRADANESISEDCSNANVILNNEIESPDKCLSSAGIVGHSEIIAPPNEIDQSPIKCRLCYKDLNENEPFINLAASLHLNDFINRVMNNQISLGDDISQICCKNCENNALLSLIIIQQMDETQKKFGLAATK